MGRLGARVCKTRYARRGPKTSSEKPEASPAARGAPRRLKGSLELSLKVEELSRHPRRLSPRWRRPRRPGSLRRRQRLVAVHRLRARVPCPRRHRIVRLRRLSPFHVWRSRRRFCSRRPRRTIWTGRRWTGQHREAAEARAEAVAILETASRTSRRVFGPSHPITVDIELVLTRARRRILTK